MNPLGGLGGEESNTLISSPLKKPTQIPKRKQHFFTWNNYTESDIGGLLSFFDIHSVKYAFQEEIAPSTGTPHLQGMVIFKEERRSTQWDPHSKGHWEKLKDSTGKYQLKEESRKPGGRQWTKGFPKPIKIIENLYPWQQDALDIYNSEPDDRKIYWFWESIGKVGKSAFVKYMVVKYNCLFCDGGKKSDLINLVFNNNMDDCKCIIWDIPRASKGNISYATLESIKNGLICNTKYETGVKAFNPPHIFVFANFPPEDEQQLSQDRWVIREL